MQRLNSTMTRGAIAGFLAATALAVWFLFIDIVEADPFRTPLFVARALAGLDGAPSSMALLALYTGLHFAVFVLLGIAVSWVLQRTRTVPYVLLGFVLGFLLFDVVFYVGVIVTGVDVVRELGWPQVLVGNLIAGLTLLGYLNMTSPGTRLSWRKILRERQTLREGLVGAMLGAAIVMFWFFLMDIGRDEAFFTPAALGSALFHGARGVEQVQITAGTVIGYTIIHIAAFLAVGFIAAALAVAVEHNPSVLLGLGLLFVTFEVLFIGLLSIIAAWLIDALNWWAILAANLLAAAVMGGYLWHEHPKLHEVLGHNVEEDMFRESEV